MIDSPNGRKAGIDPWILGAMGATFAFWAAVALLIIKLT
jgi:hypothetical protein